MKTINAAQTQFHAALVAAYTELFVNDPAYAYSASKLSPSELADKMLPAAISGSANYTGNGFKLAARACGIKHTAKSIKAFLDPLRNAADVPAVCVA